MPRHQPTRHAGPTPIPDVTDIRSRFGPTHISPRDLAWGLRAGTIKIVDVTGDPNDPDTLIDGWLNDEDTKTGGKGKWSYDPMKVYTASVNRHDHSTTLRLKLSPELLRAARMMSEMVPEFGSVQGFIRDAILHSLHHWVARMDEFVDEGVARSLDMMTVQIIAASLREKLDGQREMFVQAEEIISAGIEQEDIDAVEMACDVYEAMAGHMPELHRERMLEIVGRGRGWLRDAKKRELVKKAKAKVEREKAAREREREMTWEGKGEIGEWADGD